ncbi:hypothetical protein JTB14_031462 [Gonioctena quinquepunctata]|nr:hypothetical protein JTB14_031462 [Gonioctena quinquepunctata]
MTKPKPKPVVETTPRETIINKPGPSYEISNKYGPLANSEESNVETGKKIEVGYETDRIERSARKRAKKQVQKEAKRKNNEKNTKEVTDNAEIIPNMETNQKTGKRDENPAKPKEIVEVPKRTEQRECERRSCLQLLPKECLH